MRIGRVIQLVGVSYNHLKGNFIMTNKRLNPGDRTPQSGQYLIIGPRGGDTGSERTSVQGKPLPPTPRPGQGYRLVDPTKH